MDVEFKKFCTETNSIYSLTSFVGWVQRTGIGFDFLSKIYDDYIKGRGM
jgi:hypothetical protein